MMPVVSRRTVATTTTAPAAAPARSRHDPTDGRQPGKASTQRRYAALRSDTVQLCTCYTVQQ